MTIPAQKVEELAVELRDKYIECFRRQAPTDFVWEDFAKHVLGLIIQAKLEVLNNLADICVGGGELDSAQVDANVQELTEQLQSLNLGETDGLHNTGV